MRLLAAEPTVPGKGLQLIRSPLGVGGGLGQVVAAGLGKQGGRRWAARAITARGGGLRRWLH
ncbi:MAG: hypothetical protein NTZ53_14810 [Cyanobacteria bacterium]|nr:hypothetical protein [Cyanobacteriota bacterium]